MAPQSRGAAVLAGLQSMSTPTLPTDHSLGLSAPRLHHEPPSEPSHSHSASSASSDVSFPDPSSLLGPDDDMSPSSSNEDDSAFTARLSRSALPISRSHTHLTSSSGLFPPFYNRPPTPLPPSPSLTSLLRPSFSTQSRPTTPDSSDIDSSHPGTGTPPGSSGTTNTAAVVAKSARTATTVPRASPKVPSYEYYGFALYLASSAAFLMYMLWSFLPSPFLHQLGIDYYPNRWWALAVPAWLVVAVVWIYVALGAYNVEVLTLPLGSVENIVDECGTVAGVNWRERRMAKGAIGGEGGMHARRSSRRSRKSVQSGDLTGHEEETLESELVGERRDRRNIWSEGTDAVMDVPIGGVCEILYGDGSGTDDEDGSDGDEGAIL